MPGEKKDDLVLDNQEQQNEGLEAEADANDQDGEVHEDGDDAEGSEQGDGADAARQEEVDGEPRRPSRGEVRFQKLSQSAREANERATKAEQKAAELEQRLSRVERPQEQPRGKSPEELALMTPDELINYRLGEATKGFEQKLGAIQWATYEGSDKAAFKALMAADPVAARYADEVEQRLQAMRAQGQNVDRERLLTYIVGEKVRSRGATAKNKQQGEGQRRIAAQTVRPAGQRSDTPRQRGQLSEAEAREKRLENITF